MRGYVIEPQSIAEEVLITVSDAVVVDKKTAITVPNQFKAVGFVDEKQAFRVDPCANEIVYKKYGKDLLGKELKIVYVRTKAIPAQQWGFGGINVNNARLQEAYQIGANGTFRFEIVNMASLLKSFPLQEDISVEEIKKKAINTIKSVGIPALGTYFAGTEISVFEIDKYLGEMRELIFEKLRKESVFSDMGIKIIDFTVAGTFVPDEDKERIRNRINGEKRREEVAASDDNVVLWKEEFDRLAQNIQKQISEELKKSEERTKSESDEKINEMQETYKSLLKEIENQMSDKFDAISESIVADLDEKFQATLPLYNGAKESEVEKITVTPELLLEQAKNIEDLVPVASVIYSNVEKNLIEKFGLEHKNNAFVIDFREYTDIADKAYVDGKYLLKRRTDKGTLEIFIPNIVKKDENGQPVSVEMTPLVRFLKIGLSPEDARTATAYWIIMNKIRHRSKQNEQELQILLSKQGKTGKKILTDALHFYREKGLCTK